MKVFIISHIADSDGITPIILARLAFKQVDYALYEVSEVNEGIISLIKEKAFDNYDKVFITDLGISNEVLKTIDEDSDLKRKLLLFDHHIGNYHANDYSFATVIDTDENNQKQSGTSLFYKYLLTSYSNEHLAKESVSTFVNLVREYDTWEWSKINNLDAKALDRLFSIYGKELFESHFYSFLKDNDTFKFDEKELFILDITEKQVARYINDMKEKVIPATILGHKAGIVFASKYRSELGNELAKHYADMYDFIVLINVERGVSYRGIKDVNLSEVAQVFGGKGHYHASGSPLPKDLQSKILKHIFNDKITLINGEI